MKKYLLIAACLIISGMALAQNPDGDRISVRFGAGFPASTAEKFVQGLNTGHYGIHGIYDDYYSDTKSTPAISATCMYIFNEWMSFGAEMIYVSCSNQRIDAVTDKVKADRKGQSLIFMPTAQVSYYQKGLLRIYLGMSAGFGYYSGFDNLDEKVSFELKFVPFGVEFGRRVFVFAEGCLGTSMNWAQGGVGFKF